MSSLHTTRQFFLYRDGGNTYLLLRTVLFVDPFPWVYCSGIVFPVER